MDCPFYFHLYLLLPANICHAAAEQVHRANQADDRKHEPPRDGQAEQDEASAGYSGEPEPPVIGGPADQV